MRSINKKIIISFGIIAIICLIALIIDDKKAEEYNESQPEILGIKYLDGDVLGGDNDNRPVKYAYKGDKLNNDKNEIINKRNKHTKFFKNKDGSITAEIISGVPQYYEDDNGEWWQAEYATSTVKELSKKKKISLLDRLFGNVAYADTDTFYPDANPETSSMDGNVRRIVVAGEAWSSIRTGAGTNYDDTSNLDYVFYIDSDTDTDEWNRNDRAMFLFDTSSLDDDVTIDSATLSIYGESKNDNLSITPNVNVVSANPASNTAIEASDYVDFGSTVFSTAIAYADISTSGYNDFALNASGLSNISKTGISKFGILNQNYDIDNSGPSWSSNVVSNFRVQMAETTGTSQDPKLVIVYTPSSVDDEIIIITD